MRAHALLGSVVIGGILAAALKEVIFARSIGATEALDTFRVLTFFGYFAALNAGPVFVAAALPTMRKNDGSPGSAALWSLQSYVSSQLGIVAAIATGVAALWIQAADWRALAAACGGLSFFLVTSQSLVRRAWLVHNKSLWQGASVSLISSGCLILGCVAGVLAMPDRAEDALPMALLVSALLVVLVHRLSVPANQVGEGIQSFRGSDADPKLKRVVRDGLIYRVILLASLYLDLLFVAALPTPGAVSLLQYGFAISAAATTLIGTVASTAVMPALLPLLDQGGSALRRRVATFSGVAFAATVLISIAFGVLADLLVSTLFGGGGLSPTQIQIVSDVTIWYLIAAPFSVAAAVISQSLLIMGRSIEVMLSSAISFAIKLLLLSLLHLNDMVEVTQVNAVALIALCFVSGLMLHRITR